ncbi:hypothetical protein BAE44_0020867 [Dichanthelium oligosanthes]|uniref:FBD domain-containing protein n=1 Tax=Dichanthelium oligosanthes TaxID=888268 RepID=A0A1E5UYW7_9POAL|nr:hypothetical protein BAE44_0020867 [Dichanthelium oligosanthes]
MNRQDIRNFRYLMVDITMLPKITFLHVAVLNQGHAFGGSLFHLLRICPGLRRLSLVLHTSSSLEAQSACPSGCICDQPTSWKTEELLLKHLEDTRIRNLKGAEHEVAFFKRLFNCAKVLKSMSITFDYPSCKQGQRVLPSISRTPQGSKNKISQKATCVVVHETPASLPLLSLD